MKHVQDPKDKNSYFGGQVGGMPQSHTVRRGVIGLLTGLEGLQHLRACV